MVHNGIEYADMQMIAEIYDLLHRGLGLSNQELYEVFSAWNEGPLKSYLIEITADIFKKKDELTGQPLIDLILDEAKQKGTGKWTSQNAFDIGAPIPTINAAVESRILSGLKEERVRASEFISGPKISVNTDKESLIQAAHDALYASKITAYAQGMGMLKIASQEYDYQLNLREIAKIWRAGCIIRAELLNDVMDAYQKNPDLINLLMDDSFILAIDKRQEAWRLIVTTGINLGIPMLAIGSSLAYFDAYRTKRLPANLTQAQRDYFGAHTYRRTDREGIFHTEWPDPKVPK
jgi:6-phosphogluconate dehydrogenase